MHSATVKNRVVNYRIKNFNLNRKLIFFFLQSFMLGSVFAVIKIQFGVWSRKFECSRPQANIFDVWNLNMQFSTKHISINIKNENHFWYLFFSLFSWHVISQFLNFLQLYWQFFLHMFMFWSGYIYVLNFPPLVVMWET